MQPSYIQAHHKEKSETCRDFGDLIKTLVNHVFPSLELEAKDVIALNLYLSHIGNLQVKFAVQQLHDLCILLGSFDLRCENVRLTLLFVLHQV